LARHGKLLNVVKSQLNQVRYPFSIRLIKRNKFPSIYTVHRLLGSLEPSGLAGMRRQRSLCLVGNLLFSSRL